MPQQGIQLLEHFAQDDRIRIPRPRRNLQIKFARLTSERNEFVAYIDAIGLLDGVRSVIWQTGAPVPGMMHRQRASNATPPAGSGDGLGRSDLKR